MKSDDDDDGRSNIACGGNTLNSLPPKSRERYEYAYGQFMKWCRKRGVRSPFSESDLLMYFDDISGKIAPSTLWTQFSMLRSTLSSHQMVNIAHYAKLKAFLKRKSDGYRPKRSKKLTAQEINRFIDEAPDDKHLLQKVVIIFGICGSCRKCELVQLKIDDIEDLRCAALVKVRDAKTKTQRPFTITGKFYDIYGKYAALRPSNTFERRFFLNYQNRRCTRQPVGINKLAGTQKLIATYLGLKDPELYTGHCYRRSSAMMLEHGDGGSAAPEERRLAATVLDQDDVEESRQDKIKVEDTVVNFETTGPTDFNEPYYIKTEDTCLSSSSNAGESLASAADLSRCSQMEEPTPNGRDQFEIFGAYVGSELRGLRSDYLRRKLKRKIQQAILEVSAEEDQ